MPKLKSLAQPVAVVCHDAGAANIILAEMRAAPEVKYLPVMQGPAAKLWVDKGCNTSALLTLNDALFSARSVVSGTSWASDVEHQARLRAKPLRLPSIAVIDHWVNYPARFEREGIVALPDELWVTDRYAFNLASMSFSNLPIQLLPNRYLEGEVQKIAPLSAATADKVLYVLEPLRFNWPGCTQAGEFEALDYFVSNLGKIAAQKTLQIHLRPHPSDAADKYTDWIAANVEHNISLDTSPSLSEAISRVEWVAGCETAAMVVALAAGRKVLATLPPNAPKCRLPHEGLLHLVTLLGER